MTKGHQFVALVLLALLAVVGAGGAASEPVTAAEVDAVEKRFELVRKVHLRDQKILETKKKEAGDEAAAKEAILLLRKSDLHLLRWVILLERDLGYLGEPKIKVHEGEIRGVTSSDRLLVTELRQKIRHADLKRIRAALKESRAMHGNYRTDYDINHDEIELDSVFARNTARLGSALGRARREIAREKGRRRIDEPRVEALRKEIDELEEEIDGIRCFVYGYAPGAGFEDPARADASPAGKLRSRLVAERDRLLAKLRGESGGTVCVVGGAFVYSSDIGVILDVSPGMDPHAESLKKEINAKFAGAHYREVSGCRISINGSAFHPYRSVGDTLLTMEELIVVHGVDTLYWFCDLQAQFYYGGVRHLRYLLRRGGVALHVKSMDKRPRHDLELLMTDFRM